MYKLYSDILRELRTARERTLALSYRLVLANKRSLINLGATKPPKSSLMHLAKALTWRTSCGLTCGLRRHGMKRVGVVTRSNLRSTPHYNYCSEAFLDIHRLTGCRLGPSLRDGFIR